MASLRVSKRPDTGTLWITGTVAGRRIRQAAGTGIKRLAQERAAQLEADILRGTWHGEKRGSRPFGEVVEVYAAAKARRAPELIRLARLVDAVGEKTPLRAIDQETVLRIGAGKKPPTLQREIITPLRAVLTFAARRKWCDVPLFETQSQPAGRTLFLLPGEAECLVRAGADHLRPLLLFLISTGARLSEALELEWRDVDLEARRVIFWRTKNGKRRIAELPPRVVARLLPLRASGRAFPHWRLTDRNGGGQIKTAFGSALKRAGLSQGVRSELHQMQTGQMREGHLTPHCLRHTWATWHYALHRDLLRLKEDGGWASVALVERYAHLMPAGQEAAIREFLGLEGPQLRVVA